MAECEDFDDGEGFGILYDGTGVMTLDRLTEDGELIEFELNRDEMLTLQRFLNSLLGEQQ